MNPQQIQQVRTIAQDQILPFQKQHASLIESLEKKITSLSERTQSLSNNIDSDNTIENLQIIIKKQKEENDKLRNILSLQKEEHTQLRKTISEQVNDHTKNIDNNINEKLIQINSRLIELEKNERNFSIPIESLESVFDTYQHKKIESINNSIEKLHTQISDLETKKDTNENDKMIIQQYQDCLSDSLPELAAIEVRNKLNLLKDKFESIDIQEINKKIDILNKEKGDLKNKLSKLNEIVI